MRKKGDIFVLWGNFPPAIGGGSSRGYRIYNELANRGHKIKVFVGKLPGTSFHERLSENLDLYRIPPSFHYPLRKGIHIRVLYHFIILIRYFVLFLLLSYLHLKERASIIIVEATSWEFSPKIMKYLKINTTTISPWVIFKKKNRLPAIVYFTNMWCAEDIQVKTESIYADKIIIVDRWMKEKLVKLGIKKKVSYIPVSVNTKETVTNNPSNVVLFVGRLATDKACDTLIMAIPIVLTKSNDIKFIIVGTGAEEKILKNVVKEFKVDKNVEFKGYIPPEKIKEFQKITTVLVNPVRSPGISNVVIESMANGVPVIKSRYNEYKEYVVKDGFNGYTFEVDNPKDLADKIVKIFNESEKWWQLSKNAKETAKQYDNTIIIDKFERTILETLSKWGGR